jgi:methanesulfonate monooxygenase small subunit
MSEANRESARRAVEDVIYSSCLYLDKLEFETYLELAAPEFRKEMTWLDHDREGLKALLDILPKHHVNHALWHRHAVVYQVVEESPERVRAVTSLMVHHTLVDVGDAHLEAGATRVFAVGRYFDTLRNDRGRWLLSERTVRLDTRQLGIGTHLIV